MGIIKTKEMLKLMGCSRNTLKKRIKQRIYPRPIRGNLRIGFLPKHVEDFLNQKKQLEIKEHKKFL